MRQKMYSQCCFPSKPSGTGVLLPFGVEEGISAGGREVSGQHLERRGFAGPVHAQ